MAIGDDATAAGIPLVQGTADVRDGYKEDNITRDEIARRASRKGLRIYVGAAPSTPQAGDIWLEYI